MSHQRLSAVLEGPRTPSVSSLPPATCKRSTALKRLQRAFRSSRPLAALMGETQSSTRSFLNSLPWNNDNKVTVIRLAAPFPTPHELMRQIIHEIGFESRGLSQTDLENVFKMYLGYQKAHNTRTVLCLEEIHNCTPSIMRQICALAGAETDAHYGLMILASGRPALNDLIDQSRDMTRLVRSNHRILLAPFSLADTREFIKSRIESSGTHNVAAVFEFDAITRIHDLSNGTLDQVNKLFDRCMQLVERGSTLPLTDNDVNFANTAGIDDAEAANHTSAVDAPKRLTIRMNGEISKVIDLNQGHVLIGRDKYCNIRIISPSVSRHHALLVNVAEGITLIDLASTNGTVVDKKAVKYCPLSPNDEVAIGDHTMTLTADRERQNWALDIAQPPSVPIHKVAGETQTLKRTIKGNINAKGEKIYHVEGTASYKITKIDESKGERWFLTEDDAIAAGWRAARR